MKVIKFAVSLLSLCFMAALTCHAQDNPYFVSNEAYYQFLELTREDLTEIDVVKADSLAKEAGKKGNYLEQCLYWSIPARYYRTKENSDDLNQWCDSIRKAAARTDKEDMWLFWLDYTDVSFLIHNGKLYDALDKASKLRTQAEETKNSYGLFLAMVSVAHIYRLRNDVGLAGECYKEALEYQQANLPNLDPSELYVYLSYYYRRKSDRTPEDMEKSKEMIERGLEIVDDSLTKARLLAQKAMIQYGANEFRDFQKTYKTCSKLFAGDPMNEEFLQIKYRKHIMDRDYAQANAVAESLASEYDKYIAHYVIQRAQGHYQEALRWYEKAAHELNIIREQERRGDLADISANIGRHKLEITNQQLMQQRIKAQSEKTHVALWGACILCIIIGSALIILRRQNRTIKSTNLELENKNTELAAAVNKAQESERLKMMFIQNMSHEIRTPLNSIVGFSSLMAQKGDKLSDEKRQQFMSLINYNSDLLTTLINDILTLSDLESGKYLFDFAETNVNGLCEMAIQIARNRLKPGVTMLYESHVADDFSICIDEKRTWQIINNLLTNACKYTEKGSIVLRSYTTPEGYLRISVTDNGPGIPREKREEIFERFTKFNAFVQGTGLGLNICKLLVDKFNGRIYVDPDYDDGARFIFEIPPQKAADNQKNEN